MPACLPSHLFAGNPQRVADEQVADDAIVCSMCQSNVECDCVHLCFAYSEHDTCRIDLDQMLLRPPPREQQEKLIEVFKKLDFRQHGPRLLDVWKRL